MRLGKLEVGAGAPPVVVAEMSGNHGGSLDRALQIVDAAAGAGAHAIKLQTYTADTMTLDRDGPGFVIEQSDSLWHGRRLYDLYREAATPWEWHAPIFERARSNGIECFSSPFDASAIALLEELEAPCYKIASLELGDLELVKQVAATGKPIILSTGASELVEIERAVGAARSVGAEDIILLQCTSAYPTPPDQVHLRTMVDLRERFGCEVGLSDHTLGVAVATAAVALGASLIEKHVTAAEDAGAVDEAFSLRPDALSDLVRQVAEAHLALGQVHYGATQAEEGTRARRRSLYVMADLPAGTVLSGSHLRALRSALGLEPYQLPGVLGQRLVVDVAEGTPLQWEHFS